MLSLVPVFCQAPPGTVLGCSVVWGTLSPCPVAPITPAGVELPGRLLVPAACVPVIACHLVLTSVLVSPHAVAPTTVERLFRSMLESRATSAQERPRPSLAPLRTSAAVSTARIPVITCHCWLPCRRAQRVPTRRTRAEARRHFETILLGDHHLWPNVATLPSRRR